VGIKWRESLSIGLEEIDNQHKEMLRRFDMLLTACEEGKGIQKMKDMLDFLDEYVQQHFNDEETLQQLHSYPDYAGHRKEHETFAGRIMKLREEIDKDGVALHHLIETNDLLFKWLISHISKADKEMGVFLKTVEIGK